jgi:RNA polymerase sigma-70 factor (ECF subfamily)
VREAIERIYWERRQGLFTLALAITRCPGRAEDAVQEAFARLWKSQARPGGDLVPYVFAAVRNAAIDQVRRQDAVAGAQPASIFNGLPADPPSETITAEEHRMVREAVESLPDEQREAVVMRIYGNLTFDEMAKALGEPLQTVASRYRRAIEKLSEKMKRVAGPNHDQ